MAFKYYHIFIITFAAIPIIANGQGINEYRMEYGFSAGYRSFNLDETNDRVNFFNDGNLKPDHGSSVFSANVKGRPFKKNNLFVNFRFDYLPNDTRNYFAQLSSPPIVLSNPKSAKSDTVYSYDNFNTSTITKMCFASLQVGYDISFNKFMLSLECGAIFGSFFMYQFQNQQTFYKFDQGSYDPGPLNSNIYNYQTKNNFGINASATLTYPLYSRLNADFSFSLEALNPEVTLNNGTLWMPDGYFGVKDFGFYYPRVLTAQLSGIQVSVGLSYILF